MHSSQYQVLAPIDGDSQRIFEIVDVASDRAKCDAAHHTCQKWDGGALYKLTCNDNVCQSLLWIGGEEVSTTMPKKKTPLIGRQKFYAIWVVYKMCVSLCVSSFYSCVVNTVIVCGKEKTRVVILKEGDPVACSLEQRIGTGSRLSILSQSGLTRPVRPTGSLTGLTED